MASIRCKTCGRTYDYGKEGFCPNCGAYNRPPRQAWVGAVLAVVIAVVVVSVLRGLVGHTGFDLSHREPGHSGEAGSPAEEIRPAVWERAEVGAHFTLGENADETTSVDAVWIDEDEKLHAVVTLEETYQSFPSLFGTDGNGASTSTGWKASRTQRRARTRLSVYTTCHTGPTTICSWCSTA